MNKKISEQKQKIIHLDKTLLEKDLMIENLKSISVVKSPSVSKNIKIFGISVYHSETKLEMVSKEITPEIILENLKKEQK